MKKYGYTFRGSPLAHQKPLTEAEICSTISNSIECKYNTTQLTPEDFQVYELVPVKLIPAGLRIAK